MPTKIKITKEMILDAAFEIAKEEGIEVVSNRTIAKRLNSSIRPIYYQFENSKELNQELRIKIEKYSYHYLMDNINDDMPAYKQVGVKYIEFAKYETNLFKVLFMSRSELFASEFITQDEEFKELSKIIKLSTELSDSDIELFHTKMWIFTHGIATLIATGTVVFTDEQIKELLSYEFQALMLLENNKDNKWVIKNKKEGVNNE